MENLPASPRFRWKWLLAVACLLLTAWWGYRWAYPSYQPPRQPMPNGYTELIQLSRQLARRTGWYNQIPADELEAVVATNKPILDQARAVLRRDCLVPLDWQADRQWFDDVHLKDVSAMKELSRAFSAEGLLALNRGDTRLAINSGLENIHLSSAVANGGLGTDWLSGVATATLGLMTLRGVCDIATAEDCQMLLKTLPDVGSQFEAPAVITAREWYFFRRINGVWQTFLTEMTFANNRAEFERRMHDSLQVLQARTELLRLHYLIRAFQLKHGRLPELLGEIGESDGVVYQAVGASYLLYSVGLDGIDDGGAENPQDPRQGDVQLESSTPPSNTLLPIK